MSLLYIDLHRPEAEGARLLIAGRNFGCGSSRVGGGRDLHRRREANVVSTPSRGIPFRVDAFARNCLLEGLDELSYILRHEDVIATFEVSHPERSSIVPPEPAGR